MPSRQRSSVQSSLSVRNNAGTVTLHVPKTSVRTPTLNTRISTIKVHTPTVRIATPTIKTPTVSIRVPTVRVPTISDIRLKRDIVELGRLANGLHLYRYRYPWSDTLYVGVMAQEVLEIAPQAVVQGADGYLRVDYSRLGLQLSTWDDARADVSARSP